MHWLFAIALLSVPVAVGEMLNMQCKDLPPELSRKFVHITAAVCAACLMLLLSLEHISLLAIALTPGMFYMHHKGTLRSMSSRSHRSYGDVFFGLGCAGAALLANNGPHLRDGDFNHGLGRWSFGIDTHEEDLSLAGNAWYQKALDWKNCILYYNTISHDNGIALYHYPAFGGSPHTDRGSVSNSPGAGFALWQ